MRWLLVGYMFLFIDRPFEVWPWLGDLHFERVYMLFTLAVWAVHPGKRFLPNAQHLAYAAFATAVLACWAMSPWAGQAQPVVENWLKILVFYVLLVTTVHDEDGLRHVAIGFIVVMGLYMAHSFREYLGGRHTHRMGIVRMIGVDSSLGDPNSFAASIVFALPFAAAFWRAGVWGRAGRFLLVCYVGLSSLCVLLTGSRGGFIALLLWFGIAIYGHPRRWTFLAGFLVAAPLAFVALPGSLQTRFETIIDPDVGPANAKESGEGRIQGFLTGLELWAANPLNGVGPGAWRPATRSTIEAHNLYGQLLGETGTLGAVSFAAILAAYWVNWSAVRRVRRLVPEWRNDLVFQIAGAAVTGVFLLLFMGNFGHNLFRFSWVWYGGFLIIARHCIHRRLVTGSHDPIEDDVETEDEPPPVGWVEHDAHPAAGHGPFVGAR